MSGTLEIERRRDDAPSTGDENGVAVAEAPSKVDVEFGKGRPSTLAIVAIAERAGGESHNARSCVSSLGYVGSRNGRDII